MSTPGQNENPYASPQTQQSPGKPVARQRGFSLMAVFVGWLADIGFTLVVSLVLGMVGGFIVIMEGVRPDDQQALTKAMTEMHWLLGMGLLLGCGGTALGGYIAARVGKVMPIQHALAMGIVSLVTGLVALLLFPEMQPLWVSVLGAVLVIPSALLGGAIRHSQITSK